MSNFNDKVVVITGAASGFGKILAEKLSAYGAKLILGDINEEALQRVAKSLQTPVLAQRCDVSKESDVKALADAGAERFSGIDIAINNAGLASPMKSLFDTTEEEMDLNFSVNAKGVFFGMKHQIPYMLKQGEGIILNVASMAGIGAAPRLTAYAASKHAVVGITKSVAIEFARKNIRVNAVCPYFSPTPLVATGNMAEKQARLAEASPMKRLGSPEEMVNTMLMIIDPDNSYLNGQAIAIDGGYSA